MCDVGVTGSGAARRVHFVWGDRPPEIRLSRVIRDPVGHDLGVIRELGCGGGRPGGCGRAAVVSTADRHLVPLAEFGAGKASSTRGAVTTRSGLSHAGRSRTRMSGST